jgi:hypothetical protein
LKEGMRFGLGFIGRLIQKVEEQGIEQARLKNKDEKLKLIETMKEELSTYR